MWKTALAYGLLRSLPAEVQGFLFLSGLLLLLIAAGAWACSRLAECAGALRRPSPPADSGRALPLAAAPTDRAPQGTPAGRAARPLRETRESPVGHAVPPGKADVVPPGPPVFDGFPYLVSLVMSGLHHIMLLPSDLPFNELREITHRQVRANKLQAGLAFGPRLCLYVYTNGTQCWSETVPRGAPAVTGSLRPCRDFPETPDMAERRQRLAGFIRANNPGGYLLGDLTKGGRPATFEESVLLAGLQENGVPRGLTRCLVCGEWQGRCLDPSPEFAGMVMQLDCPCANDNLCARCGRPLADRKLHSNYYDQATGTIWHVPSFCGLSHKCCA